MDSAKQPCILGIESSCDETAAAVVLGPREVRSHVVATQYDLHEAFGGVVPEIASRAHLEHILPVIRTAMSRADVTYRDLDGVAVGHRPGLIGSLLVGTSAAKAIAWGRGIPLIGVDHIAAHLHATTLDAMPYGCPALGLVVSGGHTSLFLVERPTDIVVIGKTIDDAVGEAFDKAATILGLGYPGGPSIDRLSTFGDEGAYDLPVSTLDDDDGLIRFSFSGLKTALLYAVRGQPIRRNHETIFQRDADDLTDVQRADFAASFQRAAVCALLRQLERAVRMNPDVRSLVVGGGVSANRRLRSDLVSFCADHDLRLHLPAPRFCVDNAAMIAGMGAMLLNEGRTADLSLETATHTILKVRRS